VYQGARREWDRIVKTAQTERKRHLAEFTIADTDVLVLREQLGKRTRVEPSPRREERVIDVDECASSESFDAGFNL
jgi:hypothetical protein